MRRFLAALAFLVCASCGTMEPAFATHSPIRPAVYSNPGDAWGWTVERHRVDEIDLRQT